MFNKNKITLCIENNRIESLILPDCLRNSIPIKRIDNMTMVGNKTYLTFTTRKSVDKIMSIIRKEMYKADVKSSSNTIFLEIK